MFDTSQYGHAKGKVVAVGLYGGQNLIFDSQVGIRLTETNPTLRNSWLDSLGWDSGDFTCFTVEVDPPLFIGFNGWEFSVLIFDGLPSICPTPTEFHLQVHWFIHSQFHVSSCFLSLLLYSAIQWVFRGRFEGMNQLFPHQSMKTLKTFWNVWPFWLHLQLTRGTHARSHS